MPEVVFRGVPRSCDDEQSLASVRGSHVGSSDANPSRVVPDVGQRPENGVESESKVSSHVLQHDKSRSHDANAVSDEREDVSRVIGSFSLACVGERLARVTRGHDLSACPCGPVDGLEVAKVGDVGEAVGEDLVRALVDVRDGDKASAGDGLHRKPQPLIARAETQHAEFAHADSLRLRATVAPTPGRSLTLNGCRWRNGASTG